MEEWVGNGRRRGKEGKARGKGEEGREMGSEREENRKGREEWGKRRKKALNISMYQLVRNWGKVKDGEGGEEAAGYISCPNGLKQNKYT